MFKSTLDVLMRVSGDSSGARRELRNFKQDNDWAYKEVTRGVKTAAKTIGIALAGMATALQTVVKQTAEMADKYQKAALRTGETAESLSALDFAAERSGTSFESLEKSLQIANRRLYEAERGTETAVEAFGQLGIRIHDSNGNLRKASDVIIEFAEKTKDWTDDTKKAALAQELFGRSGAQLLPLMSQGAEGIEKMKQEAADLGFVMSTDTADAGAELKDRMTDLEFSLKGLRNTIGAALFPVISKTVKEIIGWVKANREMLAQKITAFFKGLVSTIQTLYKTFKILAPLIITVTAALATMWVVNKATAFISLVKAATTQLGFLKISALKAGAAMNMSMSFSSIKTGLIAVTSNIGKTFGMIGSKLGLIIGHTFKWIAALNPITRIALVLLGVWLKIRSLLKDINEEHKKMNESRLRETEMRIKNEQRLLEIQKEYTKRGGNWMQDIRKKHLVGLDANMAMGAMGALRKQDKLLDAVMDDITSKNKKRIEEQKRTELAADEGTIEKLKKQREEWLKFLQEQGTKELEHYRDLSNREYENEKTTVDRKKELSQEIADAEMAILAREKAERIEQLKSTGKSEAEIQAALAAEYAYREQEIRDAALKRIEEIEKEEKESAQRRLEKQSEISREFISLQIEEKTRELENDKTSKDKKLQLAQEIYDLKIKLIDMEMEAELALISAEDEFGEEKAANIRKKYQQMRAEATATYNQVREDTQRTLTEGEKNFLSTMETINYYVSLIGDSILQVIGLFGGSDSPFAKGLDSMVNAFDSATNAVSSFLSGNIGGAISGAISAIGSLVSAIGEWFGGESPEEKMAAWFAGHKIDWESLSEDLRNRIMESGLKGDDVLKEFATDILDEIDVTTQGQFEVMSGALYEKVQQLVASGKTMEEALKEVGPSMTELMQAAEENGWAYTDAMNLLAGQYQQYNVELEGITTNIQHLENASAGMNELFQGLIKEHKNGLELTETEFGALTNTAAGIYQKLKSQGLSVREIFAQMGPTFDSIQEAAKEFGYSLEGTGISQLLALKGTLEKHEGVFQIMDGVQAAIEGLSAFGVAAADQYQALASTGQKAYQQLIDAGVDQNVALAQSAGWLKELSQAQEKYGFTVDEGTQALLDQANAQGLLQTEEEKQHQETIDAMHEISDSIREAFGLEPIKRWGDEVKNQLDGISGSSVGVGITTGMSGLQRFATGGLVGKLLGSSAKAIIAEDGEYVLKPDVVKNIGVSTLNAVNSSGVLPTSVVPIYQNVTSPEIAEVKKSQQEMTAALTTIKNEIADIGEQSATAIRQALGGQGTTKIDTQVNVDGKQILKFISESMKNGSLKINADAII